MGVPAVIVMVGMERRPVGVPNGEPVEEDEGWEKGELRVDPLLISEPYLMGDTFGEGGGVGVTVCCCFSAMESSVFISSESRVETCCFMSTLSSSLRWEVMKSELGQASSSDIVRTKMRPRVDVSAL